MEITQFIPTTPEQIVKIKEVLQEDDDRFQNNLKLLEKWMECHPFIPKNYDREMLPIYLRCCKYNMETVKKKLECYFIYKKRYPEMFSYYDFTQEELKTFDCFYFMGSKNLTPEGCAVCHVGFRGCDIANFNTDILCKLLLMFATFKANKSTISAGDIVVVNLSAVTPGIVASMLTPLLRRSTAMFQSVFPFRIKGLYITFLPGYAVSVANIMKMLFKEKIRKRIYMEKGEEYMRSCIPDYCIPKDLGGTDISIEQGFKEWLEVLKYYEPWFRAHDKVQATGEISKELYAASGINEELGTQGSFRQLAID